MLGVAGRLDRRPGLGAREDGTEGDADDVEQFMPPGTLVVRVDQVVEVMPQGYRRKDTEVGVAMMPLLDRRSSES